MMDYASLWEKLRSDREQMEGPKKFILAGTCRCCSTPIDFGSYCESCEKLSESEKAMKRIGL